MSSPDMQGKVSRQDVAELCVELLDQQAAIDMTFEIKSTVPFSQPFHVDPQNPPEPRDWQVSTTALTTVHLQHC